MRNARLQSGRISTREKECCNLQPVLRLGLLSSGFGADKGVGRSQLDQFWTGMTGYLGYFTRDFYAYLFDPATPVLLRLTPVLSNPSQLVVNL